MTEEDLTAILKGLELEIARVKLLVQQEIKRKQDEQTNL
jgi:hypothetical protein